LQLLGSTVKDSSAIFTPTMCFGFDLVWLGHALVRIGLLLVWAWLGLGVGQVGAWFSQMYDIHALYLSNLNKKIYSGLH